MKKVAAISAFVCAMAAPVFSFAQATGGLTRAQVVADLVRLEQAGYNPSAASDPHYPEDIQAAEAKVAAEDADIASHMQISKSTTAQEPVSQ